MSSQDLCREVDAFLRGEDHPFDIPQRLPEDLEDAEAALEWLQNQRQLL